MVVEKIVRFLEVSVLSLGMKGVFVASLIQEIIVFIPSALTLLSIGFVFLPSSSGEHYLSNFFSLVLVASVGITVGSLFLYSITFWLGKPFIARWGKWVGLSWLDIERVEREFEKTRKDEITLFLLRAVPFFPNSTVSILAGLFQFEIKKYISITLAGTLVRASILIFVGSEVGHLYKVYADTLNRFENLIFLSTVVVLALYLLIRKSYRGKI